nr:hypothetical protein [Tanacetum cinerariifolium]
IIDTIEAQQIALDDDLVAPANRVKIGKCNHRLSSTFKSNEPTLQVVLDALKLTPFDKAFQMTANVPDIYMQEFWATDTHIHDAILPNVLSNQEMLDSKAYKEYYAVASGVKPPKAKTKYKKKADEPVTSSKSKTAHASKGSRLNHQQSKKDFHMSHVSGLGDGVDIQSKVHDEQQQKVTDYEEEEEEEKADDDEVSSDHGVYTPPDHQLTNEEENQEGDDVVKEVFVVAETPSSDTTIPQPPIPNIQPLQQTPESTTPTTIPTTTLPNIPKFASLFQFDQQSAHTREHGQKVDDLKDQSHQEFNTRNDDETSVREVPDVDESQWNPSIYLTPYREWHNVNRPPQPWITQMVQVAGTQPSFNEFLATTVLNKITTVNMGFAAALAVLVIEASQSRQHVLALPESTLFPYSQFTHFFIPKDLYTI